MQGTHGGGTHVQLLPDTEMEAGKDAARLSVRGSIDVDRHDACQ